jgi:hypothetical protein
MSSPAYDLASDAIAPGARSPALRGQQKGGAPKDAAKFGGETSRSGMAGAIRRAQDIGCNPAKSRVTVAHIYSTTDADFIEVTQQIGRILIDPRSAGSFQFFLAVSTGQQTHAKCTGASRCQHVPDGIADHE